MKHGNMKIAFDAKRAFNNSTGLGNYSRFVIETLLRHYPQHEYYLFTPSIKSGFMDFAGGHDNVHIITPKSSIGKAFPALWRTYGIAGICKKLGISVYHGLSNELPVGLASFKGKKMVTIHDLIFLRYPQYYKVTDRLIYNLKFRHACKTADIILAASDQTAEDIRHFYGIPPDKIKTVYQDCDAVYSQKTPQETAQVVLDKLHIARGRYILSVGTIEERKDQLTVLKAFHHADLEGMKLVFAGRKTRYATQLSDYIATQGLDGAVETIEGLDKEGLSVLYQNAHAFVYASLFEGFGIPVLEAMRSGVPVLAARTSSLTEVGGDAALYFAAGDIEVLSQLLKSVADHNVRKSMIDAGFKHSEMFRSDKIANKLAEVYQSSIK